jgi:hypothetical protein
VINGRRYLASIEGPIEFATRIFEWLSPRVASLKLFWFLSDRSMEPEFNIHDSR